MKFKKAYEIIKLLSFVTKKKLGNYDLHKLGIKHMIKFYIEGIFCLKFLTCIDYVNFI